MRRPSRGELLFVVLICAGIVVSGVGLSVWRGLLTPAGKSLPPQPPSLPATGIDPMVIKAVQAARSAVLQSPRSAEAWGRLGMVLKAHQFNPEANACFVEAGRLDPHEPRWLYLQAIELAERDPETAVTKLQQAVKLFGRNAAAPRLRLGELLLRQGRLDEAREQFRLLLTEHPDHPRAHLDLARLALEQGDLQASLDHLRHASNDKRTQKTACILAAEVNQRLGNTAAAEHERQRAAQLPDDPAWFDPYVDEIAHLRTGKQVRLAHADWLLSQGREGEAITLLQRTVRDYPDADWAWLLLGRAHLTRKDLPTAEEALRKAAQLKAASMEVQFYLGVVLLLREDPKAAAACFRKATEVKPDFAEAYYNLGYCLLRQGDRGAALEAFRKATVCKPNYSDAHRDLGDLLAQKGQIGDALVQLGYAFQLNPTDAQTKKLLQQLLPRIPLPAGL